MLVGRGFDRRGCVRVSPFVLKYRVASGACLFLAVVLLARGFEWMMEPRYGGKRIREWVDLAASDSGSVEAAEYALEMMGPRAVPHLIQIANRPDGWQEKLAARVPANYRALFGDPTHIENVSLYSIEMLGKLGAAERERNAGDDRQEYPIADAAVPYLVRRLTEWGSAGVNRGNLGWVKAVGDFGPRATNAIPVLRPIHNQSTDKVVRHYVVRAMRKIGYWEEMFHADLVPVPGWE